MTLGSPPYPPLCFLVLAWLLGSPASSGQSYTPTYSKIVLANGMQVILHRDTTMPTVSINLSWHAGSSRDPKGKSGLASLSGKLLLATSGAIPTQQYVRLQTEAHATTAGLTNVDWTTVYSTYDNSHLETALWIEAERMRSGADQITAQMVSAAIDRAVEQKQRLRGVPMSDLQETVYHELYPKGYPYYHLVTGDTAEVKKLRLADVKKFLQLYFVPANASLTIGGHFPVEEAARLARKYFEAIPGGIHPTWDKRKTELPPPGLSNLVLQDAADASWLHLVFPGAPVTDQDDATLSLVSKILTGTSTARLAAGLASLGSNVLSVRAYHSAQELDGTFWISISCKMETNLQSVYDKTVEVLRGLTREECTDEELRMARNQYEMELLSNLEQYFGLGARCDLLNLGNLYTDSPAHFFSYPERQRGLPRVAVRDAVKKYLSPSSVLIVSIVPPGKRHLAVSAK